MRISARLFALGALICGGLSVPAASGQSHIFFGDMDKRLPAELVVWLKGNEGGAAAERARVQLGAGFAVAGDLAGKITVKFSGDEVEYPESHGVWLSRGKGFQIGGREGAIMVNYPGALSVLEVRFQDRSAIPPSDGCDLSVDAKSEKMQMRTLDVQLGGDASKRSQFVQQFFQPLASGIPAALESTVSLKARGYDEVCVYRISLYREGEFRVNTTFLDGTKGRRTNVQQVESASDVQLFGEMVIRPLTRAYESRRSAKGPAERDQSGHDRPSTQVVEDLSASEIGRLLTVLNERVSVKHAYDQAAIRKMAEEYLQKQRDVQVFGFVGVRHSKAASFLIAYYKCRHTSYRVDDQLRFDRVEFWWKDEAWRVSAFNVSFNNEESFREAVLRDIKGATKQ
jgi:hypothetical protein